MKPGLTLLSIFLLLLVTAHAQYPCVNGISTNPANPINTQLPSKRNTFFNYESQYWLQKALPQDGNHDLENGYSKTLNLAIATGTYYLLAITKNGILKAKFVVIK